MKRMSVKSRRAIALIAVVFLLVAGGLAALYLSNRREVTTSSAAAYEAYREGIENIQRFYRKEAQVAFARALALDPNFAMAMLRLAGLSNSDQRDLPGRAGAPAARPVDRAGASVRGHVLRRGSWQHGRAQQDRAGDLREVPRGCRRRHDHVRNRDVPGARRAGPRDLFGTCSRGIPTTPPCTTRSATTTRGAGNTTGRWRI